MLCRLKWCCRRILWTLISYFGSYVRIGFDTKVVLEYGTVDDVYTMWIPTCAIGTTLSSIDITSSVSLCFKPLRTMELTLCNLLFLKRRTEVRNRSNAPAFKAKRDGARQCNLSNLEIAHGSASQWQGRKSGQWDGFWTNKFSLISCATFKSAWRRVQTARGTVNYKFSSGGHSRLGATCHELFMRPILWKMAWVCQKSFQFNVGVLTVSSSTIACRVKQLQRREIASGSVRVLSSYS